VANPSPAPVNPSPVGVQPEITTSRTPVLTEPVVEEEPPWETEDPDLFRDSTHDSSRPLKRDVKKPARTELLLALIFGGMFLLGCPVLGLVGYLVFFAGGTPTTDAAKAEREPIRVNPAGGHRLNDFLVKARPGDHFLLQSDVNEANLAVAANGVIIEPAPGKTIVWKCPPGVPNQSKLLTVQAAEDVQIRNITFDGDNRAEALVILYGRCPGTKLENVRFQNMQKYGLLAANCEGTEKSPVTIKKANFETKAGQAGVYFAVYKHTKSITANRYLLFTDCVFEGPGSAFKTEHRGNLDAGTIDLGPQHKIEIGP